MKLQLLLTYLFNVNGENSEYLFNVVKKIESFTNGKFVNEQKK